MGPVLVKIGGQRNVNGQHGICRQVREARNPMWATNNPALPVTLSSETVSLRWYRMRSASVHISSDLLSPSSTHEVPASGRSS